MVLVAAGGQVMVSNGIAIATLVGIPPYCVGILTGLGTTMPEIAVAGIAARGGEGGISVGSLLGSNITDPVFSLGIGALVADVTVTDPDAVALSVGYTFFVSVAVLSLMYWRRGIDRRVALGCLGLYALSFVVL